MNIDKLTPEQQALIPVFRDKWLKMLRYRPLIREAAEKATTALYKYCGFNQPTFYYAKNPIEAQDLANTVKDSNGNTLHPDSKEPQYVEFSYWGNVGDCSWLTFYDFFQHIGMEIEKDLIEKYNLIKDIVDAGIYDMIQLDEACIIVEMPEHIRLDANNLVHCLDAPAVKWEGYEQYYLHGMNFEKDFIMQDGEKMSPDVFFKEENVERRWRIAEKIGLDKVILKSGKLVESVEALDLYTKHPVAKNCFQHGDQFLKPKTGSEIEVLKFEDLSPDFQERLAQIKYELYTFEERPYLVMNNASHPDRRHAEGVDPKCKTVWDALKFRNQFDYLPEDMT